MQEVRSLKIIGSLIAILLTVNAYYFRDMVETIHEIKIALTSLSVQAKNDSIVIQKHDREIDKLKEKVAILESLKKRYESN